MSSLVSGSPTEEQWVDAGAGRRGARRRPGSARPTLPSLRGPPARASVTRLPSGPTCRDDSAWGALRDLAPGRPQRSGSLGWLYAQGPADLGSDRGRGAPAWRELDPYSWPPPPVMCQAGSPKIRKLLGLPFPALPTREPWAFPLGDMSLPHSPPGYDISHQQVTHSASAIFSPPSLTRAAHAPPGGQRRGGVDSALGPPKVTWRPRLPIPPSHLRPCGLWEVTRFPCLPSTPRFLLPKVSLSRRDL